MNLKKIGLSTSGLAFNMGVTGKGTDRVNSNSWSLEKFIDFAASQGFGGIEAPLMRFVPNLEPSRLEALKTKLREYEMFFVMDAEKVLDIDEITALIPLAKKFDSPIIRIKSSNVLSCDRKKIGKAWKDHVKNCIQTLKQIAPSLMEAGIKISIENHQDLDSSDLAQIIQEVGSDVIGVNFDIGNAFSVCEDALNFAQKLGSSINNIHLKDYKIYKSEEGFRLVRCPLGLGSVNFKDILPFLEKTTPGAKMVIELGALEARNIAWLAPNFWEEIQPRSEEEKLLFSKLLEKEIIKVSDNSWQTPWEKKESKNEISAYEISGLESSIK